MTENKEYKFGSKVRESLYKSFMACLQEETLPWEKGWAVKSQLNPVSKREYKGINQLLLSFVASERGYSDPRWCTFLQISDEKGEYHKGEKWHLMADSKGVPVEHWSIYSWQERKTITPREYELLSQTDPERAMSYKWTVRTSTVFNLSCVEGVEAYKEVKFDNHAIDSISKFCEETLKNMGVTLIYGGDRAFYRPSTDEIHLPEFDTFKTVEDYYATLLHETAHSTGAKSRLNREIENPFGTEKYAIEELRAETASAMLCGEVGLPSSARNMDNHKAYIQSWATELTRDPNILFNAIKDADKITDYVIDHGREAYDLIKMPEKKTAEKNKHSMAELKAMAKKHVEEHNNSDISKKISVRDLSK